MELIFKLTKATFSFNITGAINLQHKEDCIEIIETPVTTVKEVKAEPLPVIKQPTVVKSNPVTNNNNGMLKDPTAAFQTLKDIRNDKLTLAIRDYLGSRLSNKQFEDIIAALQTYIVEPVLGSGQNTVPLKVTQLVYSAMFITAGVGHAEMLNFIHTNQGSKSVPISRGTFDNLKYGNSHSVVLVRMANTLWPQYMHEGLSGMYQRKYLDKYERVFEALLAGYSPYRVIAYSGASHQIVYNIRNGIHWSNEHFDYDGPYPIKDVRDCRDITVHVCKDCGKVIPVKRIKAQPDAEYCVDCQRKYEKA